MSGEPSIRLPAHGAGFGLPIKPQDVEARDPDPKPELPAAKVQWPPLQPAPPPLAFGATEASDLCLGPAPEFPKAPKSEQAPAPIKAVAWDPAADAAEARSAAVLHPSEDDYRRLRWAQRRGALGSGMVVAAGLTLLLPSTSYQFTILLFLLTALGSVVAYESGDSAPRWALSLGVAGLAMGPMASNASWILAGLMMASGWSMGLLRECT